jgi:protein TonB
MARWGASLRAQVERRKAYPRGSSASGTTVLRIAVTAGGSLAGVSVARSSGARELDQAAIQAVRRARFPAAPKELGAGTFQFNLPLAFARR